MPPIYAHEQVERLGYLGAVYTETGTHGSEGEVPRIIPGIDSNRGLINVLGDIQGAELCTAVRLQMLEEKFEQLSKNIQEQPSASTDSGMGEKLEVLTDRVARIEGVLSALQSGGLGTSNNYRRKNSGNPYNQSGKPPQIQPLDEQKLALRLNVKIPELKEKHATLSPTEFAEWSKSRDRGKYSWRFNVKDGLYHPKKSG